MISNVICSRESYRFAAVTAHYPRPLAAKPYANMRVYDASGRTGTTAAGPGLRTTS